MQLVIEAKDLTELKLKIQNLNNELNFNVAGFGKREEMPVTLQQALVDSTPQIETKPTKKVTVSQPKPATPEPKVEATKVETPVTPTTKRGKVITKEELQDLVQQLVNKKGMPKARTFLTTIGVDVLRNVPVERYVGVYDALKLELQA